MGILVGHRRPSKIKPSLWRVSPEWIDEDWRWAWKGIQFAAPFLGAGNYHDIVGGRVGTPESGVGSNVAEWGRGSDHALTSAAGEGINFGSFPFLSSFTVMAVVLWRAESGANNDYETIVGRGGVVENNSNFALGLRYRASGTQERPFLFARDGGTLRGHEAGSTQAPLRDQPIVLVGTWESGSQAVYARRTNNVFVTTGTSSSTNGADGSQNLFVGSATTATASDNSFGGVVLCVAIWDYPMLERQARALAYDPFGPFRMARPSLGFVAAVGAANPHGPFGHPFYGPFAGPVMA